MTHPSLATTAPNVAPNVAPTDAPTVAATDDRRRGAPTLARRRELFLVTMLALLSLAAHSGCLVDEKDYPANRPPTTHLAIQGDSLRTTSYHTILSWWGSDSDGHVIGYAYRWSAPWTPAVDDSLWWEDPSWTFTTATTDTFDVPIGGSYAERIFEVRAIDNDLAADPHPRSQRFHLRNAPPRVSWSDTQRHPTHLRPSLPAVSFAFTPEDFDGRGTVSHAVMWLDTIPGEDPTLSRVIVEGDTVGAFFPEHFQNRYGERTVYLQLFDKAATGSDTISWSWNVVEPSGEYLLIDNAGETVLGPADRDDRFWRARMDEVTGGNYHVYDVWTEGVFRSKQEVLPLFRLFKGVIWYGSVRYDGSATSDQQMYENLTLAQSSLVDYATSGGRLLITGHNLLGTGGALTRSFWRDQLGIELIFTHYQQEVYVSNIDLPRSVFVQCGPALGGVDSLQTGGVITMSEFFRPGPDLEPLFWLDPALLQENLNPEPDAHGSREQVYFGVRRPFATGHLALCTSIITRFRPGPAGSPEEAMNALLRDLFGL